MFMFGDSVQLTCLTVPQAIQILAILVLAAQTDVCNWQNTVFSSWFECGANSRVVGASNCRTKLAHTQQTLN